MATAPPRDPPTLRRPRWSTTSRTCDDPGGEAGVAVGDGVGDGGPGAFGDEVAEDVVGDDGGRGGDVTVSLVVAQRGGGAGVAEVVEDERVVGGGAVEGDQGAGEMAPSVAFVGGVADDEEGGDDDLEVIEVAVGALGFGGEMGGDGVVEVGAGVEGVDVDAVGNLAGEAEHPRVDGGEVDGRIGWTDGPGRPDGWKEGELVVVAVVVEWGAAACVEAGADGADVVADAGAGRVECGVVAAFDVGADLGAEPEAEPAVGGVASSQANWAVTMGLRGKATAMPVSRSMSAARAAAAQDR